MKSFISKLLSDSGEISSKRWIAILMAIQLVIVITTTLACMYMLTWVIPDSYLEWIKFTIIALMAFVCLLTGITTMKDIIALKASIPIPGAAAPIVNNIANNQNNTNDTTDKSEQ